MIFVKDLPRMVAFYGGTMRLEPIDDSRTESWVEFDTGGIRLALHAIPSHIAENIEITQPPHAREDNPIKLIFDVDDLETRISFLESEGVKIVQRPWGACDVIDPEGNIFQICSSTRSNQTGSK
jgi:predicted enzyme related to lactoylglutathione lyase